MLLFLFIYLLLTTPVSADGFDLIYNSSFSQYRQTTGISYSYIPSSQEDSQSGLSYDSSLIKGVETKEVWGNYTLESLTENSYWQRKKSLLSEIAGPPGTQVDLLYYYLNDTGHSIEVNKVLLPFSRGDSSLGNWLDVISDTPGVSSRDISISWEQLVLSRKGLMKEYVGPGVVEYGTGGSYIADSFMIKDPILIDRIDMKAEGEEIKISIALRNMRDEEIENVDISHGLFNSVYTIPAREKLEIEYSLGIEEWGSMLRITNPNSVRECVLSGNAVSDWISTDAITALAFREDGGWVNGSYLKPEGEDFCITQIPYTISFLLNKPEIEDSEVTTALPNEEDKYDEPEVLGIQIDSLDDFVQGDSSQVNNFVLPKTGVVIY